jgi:hypothetical protein
MKSMNKSVPKLSENQVNTCSIPLLTWDIFVAKDEFFAKEDEGSVVSMP